MSGNLLIVTNLSNFESALIGELSTIKLILLHVLKKILGIPLARYCAG